MFRIGPTTRFSPEIRLILRLACSILPRLLYGEYEEALVMGIRVLKISGVLKMSRTKFTILPQLIQLMVMYSAMPFENQKFNVL